MQDNGRPATAIVTPDQVIGKSASLPATSSQAGRRPQRIAGRLFLLALVLLVLVQVGWPAPANPLDQGLREITSGQRFDLFNWEVSALTGKLRDLVANPAAGLTPEHEILLVRQYVSLAQRAGWLQSEIEQVLANGHRQDQEEALSQLRSELASLRRLLSSQSPIVEVILERQITRQIEATDLTTLGMVWPPPKLRFTAPPQLLVVSPRDHIERLRSVDLQPDLDATDRASLEARVAEAFDLSGYATTIGGYGAYPTMVVDRHGLPWTVETIAHEWTHNYLAFHPLGWSFLKGGESVTINETVASIVGEELGRGLLETYYPDLLPPPPTSGSEIPAPEPSEEALTFDFGQEMRATRLRVDELLAQGRVEEAEAYMEARRREFVAQGYNLRVLNQAYFAFHGSYATSPASSDPIGPKLVRLRELSPSLREFLTLVDGMTSVADIDAALDALEPSQVDIPAGAASP